MRLTPAKLEEHIALRNAAHAAVKEHQTIIDAHFKAVADARREASAARRAAKRAAGPAPRLRHPAVQIVRDYAREHMIGAHVFNNRRKHDRRVKIWVGLMPESFELHAAELGKRLPLDCKIVVAAGPIFSKGRCIAVIMPLEG